MIDVLLVDDQELMRRGLRLLLATVPDIEVVAEAADGAEALAMMRHHRPDVVLSDARMPGTDGIELVAAARQQFPRTPVVVLTTFDDDDVVHGCLDAGAAGFLLKDVSPEVLAAAVLAAHRGEMVIDPRVARTALVRTSATGGDSLAGLTRAERLVAEQVALGRSNTEIAGSLVLAEGTVKNHVLSLLRKLGQRDRTALALLLHQSLGR